MKIWGITKYKSRNSREPNSKQDTPLKEGTQDTGTTSEPNGSLLPRCPSLSAIGGAKQTATGAFLVEDRRSLVEGVDQIVSRFDRSRQNGRNDGQIVYSTNTVKERYVSPNVHFNLLSETVIGLSNLLPFLRCCMVDLTNLHIAV